MKVLYSPQRSDKQIKYSFDGEIITVTYTFPTKKEIIVTQDVDGIETPVMIEVENKQGEIVEVPKTELITVDKNIEEIFDFTNMPDGVLETVEVEFLPFNPVLSAERIDGELRVQLLNFHGSNATQDVLFPEWFDTAVPLVELEPHLEGGNEDENEMEN